MFEKLNAFEFVLFSFKYSISIGNDLNEKKNVLVK